METEIFILWRYRQRRRVFLDVEVKHCCQDLHLMLEVLSKIISHHVEPKRVSFDKSVLNEDTLHEELFEIGVCLVLCEILLHLQLNLFFGQRFVNSFVGLVKNFWRLGLQLL